MSPQTSYIFTVSKLTKILGVVNTGGPVQVKYWGRDPCGVDAYVSRQRQSAAASGQRQRCDPRRIDAD